MNTTRGLGSLRTVGALLVLTSLAAACGAVGDVAPTGEAPQGSATETIPSALLQNVPYKTLGQVGQMLTAKGATAGDATIFNNKAYMAYIRPDSSIGIVVDNDLTGKSQVGALYYSIPPVCTPGYGPALLALNNTLYLFYPCGVAMMMATSTDGTNWSHPTDILDLSTGARTFSTPPVAVAWDGHPVLFAGQKTSSTRSILRRYDVSGNTASERGITTVVGSDNRPSATVWQGQLYLAWADSYYGNEIGIAHWNDTTGWSQETLTQKVGIPGIIGSTYEMELVFRGTDSHIYHALSTDGSLFGPAYVDSASTTGHQPVPFYNNNGTSAASWVFYIGVDLGLFTIVE